MQIPKEIEKCIVFLGCNSKKGFYLGGTAFFVAVTLEEFNDKYISCLVTARHNIARIRKTNQFLLNNLCNLVIMPNKFQ